MTLDVAFSAGIHHEMILAVLLGANILLALMAVAANGSAGVHASDAGNVIIFLVIFECRAAYVAGKT